jgi:inositol-phosphate phosphatase / L-galactose 1-phosphate phosphatase / histidinol-phosphatase
MPTTLENYALFVHTRLAPSAGKSLKTAFLAHCNTAFDVETKDDGTPASRADRDTEKLLREIITAAYPAHGIVGEEFGASNTGSEFVWVLDPLDGTKEFLAKESGWGSLIALLHKGKPVLGTIIDPLQDRVWNQNAAPVSSYAAKPLEQAIIATTNPKRMFSGTPYKQGANALYKRGKAVRERLNCLGFAYAAEGNIDIAVENDLQLHDIAALLPVLWASGATCRSLDGEDYKNRSFDLKNGKARFSLVTGLDENLVAGVIRIMNGKTS